MPPDQDAKGLDPPELRHALDQPERRRVPRGLRRDPERAWARAGQLGPLAAELLQRNAEWLDPP